MGWGSGSVVFSDIIAVTKDLIPNKELRKKLYRGYWEAFVGNDWDTQGDCLGEDPAYDEIFYEKYPEDE